MKREFTSLLVTTVLLIGISTLAHSQTTLPAPVKLANAGGDYSSQQRGILHFDYEYEMGAYIRIANGTIKDPRGLWLALRPLQPPPGARGGYGLLGDDGLLGQAPGFGLRQLGGIARRFITFDSLYVVQPSGFSGIGVQEGVFTSAEAMNDITLGWVFFDLRPKFEADLRRHLMIAPRRMGK
ncbi:MAG: hypothetical protein ACLQJ7_01150 [Syntrophobacteraceae bacterium]